MEGMINNSSLQTISIQSIVDKACKEHRRKVSQFRAIKQAISQYFPNDEQAAKLTVEIMKEFKFNLNNKPEQGLENTVDSIIKKAMNKHKRRKSLFQAIENDLALIFDKEDVNAITKDVMKRIYSAKYNHAHFQKLPHTKIYDDWLIKFMHIFAEIHTISDTAKLIPDPVILMIMTYADETVWEPPIDCGKEEDILEMNKRSETVLIYELIQVRYLEYFENAHYQKILVILTNIRLYLIWNTKNYHIWEYFRKRSKIDEIVEDDDTEIDKKCAIEIANNLAMIYDEELENYLYLEIVARLIGSTKNRIRSNILLNRSCMNSIVSIFGMPAITKNPKHLIWKLWKARNRFDYVEKANIESPSIDKWKIIDFTTWNKLKILDSNCFRLNQTEFPNLFWIECRFQSSLERDKWINLIPIATKNEKELIMKNKLLLQRLDHQNNIIKKLQLENDDELQKQTETAMTFDSKMDDQRITYQLIITQIKSMQHELQYLWTHKRHQAEKLDAEITRLHHIVRYMLNPDIYSIKDTDLLKEKQIEEKKLESEEEEWGQLNEKNQSLTQQLEDAHSLIKDLESKNCASQIKQVTITKEIHIQHILLKEMQHLQESTIRLVINGNNSINELRSWIKILERQKKGT